ncbi:hypothetical protein DXT74_18010 [Chromobacterium sp. Rain0013]|nr:hypothetical protein DXT74_18010 [Chromobacterium sp. Rain0013]
MPRSPGKVCLHPGLRAAVSNPTPVSCHVCSSQWLLRLESVSAFTPRPRRPAFAGANQTSLARSGGVYGYHKVYDDLQAQGEHCGKHREARLMKQEGLRSQTGYHRRSVHYSGRPAVVAPNHLQRQFTVDAPNKAWVTDISVPQQAA